MPRHDEAPGWRAARGFWMTVWSHWDDRMNSKLRDTAIAALRCVVLILAFTDVFRGCHFLRPLSLWFENSLLRRDGKSTFMAILQTYRRARPPPGLGPRRPPRGCDSRLFDFCARNPYLRPKVRRFGPASRPALFYSFPRPGIFTEHEFFHARTEP